MTLSAGVLAAYDGISVEDFEAESAAFLQSAQHPTLGRRYIETTYAPMVELLAYLEVNGFSNYVASGGGRDFIRPVTQDLWHPARTGHRQRLDPRVRQWRVRRDRQAQGARRLPQ